MSEIWCWIVGHRWFSTVITHHDANSFQSEVDWYRGVWNERICLRCQKNEAVYDRTLRSWNVVLDKGEFSPDEFFAIPGDWAGGE